MPRKWRRFCCADSRRGESLPERRTHEASEAANRRLLLGLPVVPGRCTMILVSRIHVFSAAFLMGLATSAPMGPVNMMAIRRGVIGGERHTLVCGGGAVAGDLTLFSLALLGGHYFSRQLSNPTLQTVLAALGFLILLPAGIYFLALAAKEPKRSYKRARRRWARGPLPAHLFAEAGEAFALTVFNPLTMLYWIAVTSSWIPLANPVLGAQTPGWGILMAALGMMSWFAGIILFVHFIPRRIGARFFRFVNGCLGFLLIGFAAFCALTLSRHLLY